MFFDLIKRSITYLLHGIVGALNKFWINSTGKQIADHEEVKETAVQPTTSTDRAHRTALQEHEDTVDFLVDDPMKETLEKVSAAIYQVCILAWHHPPEAVRDQPLYKKLSSVILDTYFNIKRKARPMEEYEIMICIASAFIDHLKNVREKKTTHKYNNPKNEVDLLRKHTECLLKYWLPESLTVSTFALDFLTQIVSINVLQPMFSNLANYSFLNQLIVMTLDREGTLEQRKEYNTYSDVIEDASFTPQVASNTSMESGNINSGKKEKTGIKKKIKGIKGFFKSSKNRKQNEKISDFRASELDTTDYGDDSVETDYPDMDDDDEDENEDDDDEDDTVNGSSSIVETLIQKWKEENWTVTISKSQAKDAEYEICVSKENNELWLTERSEQDFASIYKEICTKFENVFKPNTIKDPPSSTDTSYFRTIHVKPNEFLQTLLDLIKTQEEPEAAFFLSPFKYGEKERELFFTSIPENDTQEDPVTGKIDADCEPAAHDGDTKSNFDGVYESDGFRKFTLPKRKKNHKKNKKASDDDSNAVCKSNEVFPSENANSRTEISRSTLAKQQNHLQDQLLDVIYHLADELFAGGANIVRFLHTIGYLNNKSTELLNYIPNIYAQKQIEWYLSQISELLLSESCPPQLTPDELQAKALELLEKTLLNYLPHTIFNIFIEKRLLKHLQASHKSFQYSEANKETIYGLLENLTKIITDDEREPGSR